MILENLKVNGPFWSVGFRPFFTLGILWGILVVALWSLSFLGIFPILGVSLNWHTHEMTFGFVVAIVAGFLLTASSHWSGRAPIQGKALILLTTLWFVARLVALVSVEGFFSLFLNLLFLGVLGQQLIPYLFTENKSINRIFGYLLGFLLFSELGTHFTGNIKVRFDYVSLGLIVMIVMLVGARIIPLFTKNKTGVMLKKQSDYFRAAVWLSGSSFVVASIFGFESAYAGLVMTFSATWLLYHFLKWGWKSSQIDCLLWSLHLSFFWVVIGMFYLGSCFVTTMPVAPGIHMIAYGGIGGLILAMVSRVGLGHTGRPIVGERFHTGLFLIFHLGAIIRTVGPIGFPEFYLPLIGISGFIWCSCYLALLCKYTPYFILPRFDRG